ncbi:DUF4839 domain-containing protein [Paractinoplanes toevensis]|uniref:DUF4839 domain-containing protein n=1 Tax=Paractinoplanes toevensis TaxID=571911 RepID=UPI001BB3CAB6|nr:DUF4839 domain-containing protein [Actinoplanes toevensis]
MAGEIKYEFKTVRTVRGTDGLVISKMQKDGWELVDQAQGTLRSTLNFRRRKKPLPWTLVAAAAAALVVLAGIVGVGVAFGDGDEKQSDSAGTTAVAAGSTSATPTPTATESASTDVITAENNPEFATLLKADSCDDANADFATKFAGRTVAFDGSIVNVAHHGGYDTRYDLLLGPGDNGANTKVGPAFKYENVDILDLKLTGTKIPGTVRKGDKFRFVAKVVEFNSEQCLFFLDPASTEAR